MVSLAGLAAGPVLVTLGKQAKTLGLAWDEVHEEAEHMEHAVSDRLVDRIEEYLGYPQVDPHGRKQRMPYVPRRDREPLIRRRLQRPLDRRPRQRHRPVFRAAARRDQCRGEDERDAKDSHAAVPVGPTL